MNAPKIIFSMNRVSKSTATKNIIKNISLSFFYGAKIGVLGGNGAGKSTLLRLIAGEDDNYNGDIVRSEKHTVGYLPQEPQLDPEKTVFEIVQEGAQDIVDLLAQYEKISERFAEPMSDEEMNTLLEKQAKLQDQIDACEGWELESKLTQAMQALACPPSESKIEHLSGGEKRRVALCRLLIQEPDILLLDEPTNHLDAETVYWLEQHLQGYPGTIIAVTHDRYFLDNVAGWILELDRGEGIPWEGNYSSWLEQKRKRLAQEEKHESDRQKALAREAEWISASPQGRRKKSKARIQQYEEMLKQEHTKYSQVNELYIPSGPRLGEEVIIAENISKSYGEKHLYSELNFKLPPGGIVGIIGANGAGKSTLFRMITGEETPDTGSIKVGETAMLSYVDQSRALDPEKTIFETISDGLDIVTLGKQEVNARAYVARFHFSGEDQKKKVGHLSGGERNRVHLARVLKQGGNVLLLDEPTNDLDVHTLRSLEHALEDFAGCAVVISHDRYFLDRLATHILAFEGDGKAVWFAGNFSDYLEDRKKRSGSDDIINKKVAYRKLTR